MRDLIRRYWRTLTRPSAYFSLGFLTIGGFLGGVVFWGAFNTALEFTNTETFCTGCHEMRDNPFQELQPTIHFTNRSGVRAKCSDCHLYDSMDFTRQSKRGGFAHSTALEGGTKTCIDCHKGIAHRLPNMAEVLP